MRLTAEEREIRNALIVAEYRAGDTMTETGLRHGHMPVKGWRLDNGWRWVRTVL